MSTVEGVEITGPMGPRFDETLNPRALELQVWQSLHNGVTLSDGQQVSGELVQRVIDEEMAAIAEARGDAYASGRWDDARALFTEMALAEEYNDFLTVPAYERMP